MFETLLRWLVLVILISAVGKAAAPDMDIQETIRLHNEKFNKNLATFKMKYDPDIDEISVHKHTYENDIFLAKSMKAVAELAQKAKFSVITTKHKAELAIKTVKQKIGLNASIPKSYDWRKHGIGLSVKNQGECGCCWAITIASLLEAFYKIKTGKSIELSIQYLVDCSDYNEQLEYIPDKCEKGNIHVRVLNYVLKNGICLERDYHPYEEEAFECDSSKPRMSIGFKEIISIEDDEEKIKEALYRYGPLAASIYAPYIWFDFYYQGVYSIKNFDKQYEHAVLIVGYGHDEKLHLDYWIIKNSFGPKWGEGGFIRVERNMDYLVPGDVIAIH